MTAPLGLWQPVGDDCCGCEAIECNDCINPQGISFDVTIAGLANGTICSSCDSLNDDYNLIMYEDNVPYCIWNYLFPSSTCTSYNLLLYYNHAAFFGDRSVAVILLDTGLITAVATFRKTWSAGSFPDCHDLDGEELSPFSSGIFPLDDQCDQSSATCTITEVST